MTTLILLTCAYMVREGIRAGREADRIDAYFAVRKYAKRENRE